MILETLELEMHPRELANLALVASAVADRDGFSATAEALVMIAVAAWALPSVASAEPKVAAGPRLRGVGVDTPKTNLRVVRILYT